MGANGDIFDYQTTASDAGLSYTFTVTVADPAGTIVSQPAVLAVYDPVTIVTQPSSVTAYSDNVVTFSVDVAGTAPFTFTWFVNGVDVGAYTQTFSFTATIAGESHDEETVALCVGYIHDLVV